MFKGKTQGYRLGVLKLKVAAVVADRLASRVKIRYKTTAKAALIMKADRQLGFGGETASVRS
jgi:hypothetical protein